jgi:hypothetical protein
VTFGLELSRGKGHRLEQPKNYQTNLGNFKGPLVTYLLLFR